MAKPQPIQISIPQPCHEDWKKMTPTEQGRFCSSCQKCVIDFTSLTDKQLYEYLDKHKGQYICARTKTHQLNRDILPPYSYPKHSIHKYLIAIGTAIMIVELPTQSLFAKVPYSQKSREYLPIDTNTKELYTLAGSVKDSTNEPLINAFVEISQNGIVCSKLATDEEGRYNIKLTNGVYTVKTMYTGFINETVIVNLYSNVKTVTIMKESNSMPEITITMGGMIYVKEYIKPNFWQRITNWLR